MKSVMRVVKRVVYYETLYMRQRVGTLNPELYPFLFMSYYLLNGLKRANRLWNLLQFMHVVIDVTLTWLNKLIHTRFACKLVWPLDSLKEIYREIIFLFFQTGLCKTFYLQMAVLKKKHSNISSILLHVSFVCWHPYFNAFKAVKYITIN